MLRPRYSGNRELPLHPLRLQDLAQAAQVPVWSLSGAEGITCLSVRVVWTMSLL